MKVRNLLLVLLASTIIGAPFAVGILVSDNNKLTKDLDEYKKQNTKYLAENVQMGMDLAYIKAMNDLKQKNARPRNSRGQYTSKK